MSRCGSATAVVGQVTSGGYGYTVAKSIAYAYLPVELRRQRVAVAVDGELGSRRGGRRSAVRPGR